MYDLQPPHDDEHLVAGMLVAVLVLIFSVVAGVAFDGPAGDGGQLAAAPAVAADDPVAIPMP